MPLPRAPALGQGLWECTEGCSAKAGGKTALAGSRGLGQARQVGDCARQRTCAAEPDQRNGCEFVCLFHASAFY